jgi:hypothetical protein
MEKEENKYSVLVNGVCYVKEITKLQVIEFIQRFIKNNGIAGDIVKIKIILTSK